MTSVIQILERLANANGKSQFSEMVRGYELHYRKNQEMLKTLDNVQRIIELCKRDRMGISRISMRRLK